MGSPTVCYKEILRNYIMQNVRWSKYEKEFTEDYLLTLSKDELEELVNQFNQKHEKYACFVMGAATANFLNTCCNDEVNACASAISDIYYLLGIKNPSEVDYTPRAYWIEEAEQIRTEGIWEDPTYNTIYKISCSHCKRPSPGQGKYEYCPHCGAEMKNADSKTKLPENAKYE